MSLISESQIYLRFIQRNQALLLLALLVGIVLGLAVYSLKPKEYLLQSSFELQYNLSNLSQSQILTDQAVVYLRTIANLTTFSHGSKNHLTVVKNGPFLITFEARGEDPRFLEKEIKDLTNLAKEKYPLELIGSAKTKPIELNWRVFVSVGALAGLFIGTITALTKTYFKKY